MTPDHLEQLYETLAEEIDRAGDKSEAFLARLALLLGREIGEIDRLRDLIHAARLPDE